jgi:WhiB family redox-sensing transcriptional regulator
MSTRTTLDLIDLGVDDRPWAINGACRQFDPDLFFPGPDGSAADAVKICRACPVLDECREWALDARVAFGIWGGMTERERRRVLRRSA